MLPKSLLLLGAGKMGAAMLEGWLAQGLAGETVTLVDPHLSPRMVALAAKHGCRLNLQLDTLGSQEVVILAIKPQMLDMVSASLNEIIAEDTLVLSIMAGKTMADIASRVPGARSLIRAMPNTPAAIGRGITGVVASPRVSLKQKDLATHLLKSIGQVEWLSTEAEIDMVTAVSGSGPAYVFYLTECLAKAGSAAGLAPELAMRLARATVEGAGELMFQDQSLPAETLRQNVTSPGGTTAAALEVLMAEDGLEPLMIRAVNAAKRRAGELSG